MTINFVTNQKRTIRRKLYEEFGIKVGRIPDTRRGKLYRDAYQAVPRGLPDTPSKRRNSVPQPPPRLLNQMCNKVSDGNKLHKVLGDWKMPKDLHQDSREGQEGKFNTATITDKSLARMLIIEIFRFHSK